MTKTESIDLQKEALNKLSKCDLCRKEYTSVNVEAKPGYKVHVCHSCLATAKTNFIWICMGCGQVYIRPKSMVIKKIKDPELKRAYILCEDMQIIRGLDVCMWCDPAWREKLGYQKKPF